MPRRTGLALLTLATALAALAPAVAAPVPAADGTVAADAGSDGLLPSGRKGYWFYLNPPAPPAAPETTALPPSPKPPETKQAQCENPKTWDVSCGFVTPKTFEFQSQERDHLLHNMVMHPGDPKAVLGFQKYTQWVVQQAIYSAQVWQYNKLQDPSLSPSSASPISSYGLALSHQVDSGRRSDVWNAIKAFGGILILFSRGDCDYCHAEVGPVQALASDTGVKVWNASIGGPCLDAFADACETPKESLEPAKLLHVTVVPTLFLYLPGNVWIRLSNGLTTTTTIEDRLYNLFVAWRLAATNHNATQGTPLDLNPQDQPKTTEGLKALLMKAPDVPPSQVKAE